MTSMTKRMLFVLITIIMYLPMTVVNAAPDIRLSGQMQTVTVTTMSNHHDHTTMQNKCSHCSDQHNCKSSHTSCSTSLGIPAQIFNLHISHYAQPQYAILHVSTLAQQPIPLLRPPISL